MTTRLTAAVAGWRALTDEQRDLAAHYMRVEKMWRANKFKVDERDQEAIAALDAAVELLGAAVADETGTGTHTEETGR